LRHHPGHLVDVVPTLLQVVDAQKPSEINGQKVPPAPGHSLFDVLQKDDPAFDGHFWWLHEKHRAIRAGNWKLVALAGKDWELYDLSKDRGESTDLAAKNPAKVQELSGLWERDLDATIQLVKSGQNKPR
jgi:arylsulfatase